VRPSSLPVDPGDICPPHSTHARTVCTTIADHPRGRFWCSTYASCLLVEVDKPKAYELSMMQATGFLDQIW
jgi:hypothetical protein